ncbi:MAG: hydrogenase iron-sulfur subunit [Gammaproteobacteria bacterium]|nr:hydrogenase iron-sulfur subunit [Gammaproteobacteria bacterium]MCP5136777.1 hydrogenase iron-sulfur subunit [Gammaproteobacteria bacterium]
MADEKKIGCYICKGCGLGERLDTDELETIATREGKANVVKQHDFLCNADGVKMIQDDIDNDGVNHIVIGACSRRSKAEAFNFQNVAISRANLREGVIWIRPDEPDAQETTQEMAADYIRMACAETKFQNIPAASGQQGLNKKLLVVGGGIAGMTSAIEASKAGYPATIVEKTGKLGGAMADMVARIPNRSPYADPMDTGVAAMIAAIEADSNITVHLNSTVTKTSGAPGRFSADITTESGATTTDNFGAIVQASGFTDYDANQLPEFAYGKTPDVVTQRELEAMIKEAGDGPVKRKSDGKVIASALFVQCAGQRSDKEGHLSYCSGFCCSASIKEAMLLKDRNADCDTIICFDDLRTPGAGGEDFYRSGQKKGVTFTKSKVSEVVPANGSLTVKMHDLILNDDVEASVDLVVLATGLIANSGVDIDDKSAENVAQDPTQEYKVNVDSILNLTYRQGRDLPKLTENFADSHFICFPYETRRTGIYAAGPVRRPMDAAQAIEDATGATMKAIQSLEHAATGEAVLPRPGDLSFPTFRKEGCTQCKRCTVECPFGAIDEDEQRYPQYNESRCRRCGTCMGACPVRIISFENYSVETVGQQIKAADMPEEFDEKPRILVLACENDAYPALDMAAMNGMQYSAFARVVPVRCLGSVNTIWVSDALNGGYDGIILMGCRQDENYQCHFVKGSEMAHTRMSKIADTLQTLSLEEERVATYEIAITDSARTVQIINEMEETIQKIGMSPFKF